MSTYIISITGGSCSGKTYLANQIIKEYGEKNISLIQLDSYYHDLKHLTMIEREKNNFDNPSAFDFNLLYKDLIKLKNSNKIQIPSYDYCTHTRNKNKITISKTPILIIEGIFSTYNPKIRNLINYKVYLDIPNKIRISRRINRDKKERARTEESILNQYNKTVNPMYIKYVRPLKNISDLIIKENGINTLKIDKLNNKINLILKEANES